MSACSSASTLALTVGLPKWSRLTVVGQSITPLQACEILIRTSSLRLSTNDKQFATQIMEAVYGITIGEPLKNSSNLIEYYARLDGVDHTKMHDAKYFDLAEKHYNAIKQQLHLLDLCYLENQRIVSCWVYGSHGWCNWDGSIFTDDYNIGKWPEAIDVYKDWLVIAGAFPFLKLRSQLYSGESCAEDAVPVIEFIINNGVVACLVPSNPLPGIRSTKQINEDHNTVGWPFTEEHERGCTIEQFCSALNYVRDLYKD
jgi:hypothetical protein